ncbi:predicted protein [Plenodomus lingam JN3]|uniref:Predicted protein n=1 Tax=Leptosphaeria maculans (strain JN3 / isolate v23.1.3 / race Av1-4-5-6-7-8) TaxID=985895 RepID=E4ZJV4_LEPMJ|nr:predicted protein [Plenodomus lingam JN3]CBX91389.1 predicted protein [Plenodomus lingam JN3]
MISQALWPQHAPDLLDAVERNTSLPSVLVSPVLQHQQPPGHFMFALRVLSTCCATRPVLGPKRGLTTSKYNKHAG